ncbi:ABC transporter [Tothia fuscella]|uniref:ABC transporter n=1 Tax=Tothia fuscella TaxID=1048955 RepID=A0A9P4NQ42_9PEZI|nr:ABC transporter [Tothia fuscella]
MLESPLQHVLNDPAHTSPALVGSNGFRATGNNSSCHRIWDSASARFSPCVLPYLSIIPGVIVVILALLRVFRPQIERWRPDWTKPFVVEYPKDGDFRESSKARTSKWTMALLLFSSIAIIVLALRLVYNPRELSTIILVAAWSISTLVICVDRPNCCPTSMLAFYLPATIVHCLITITDDVSIRSVSIVTHTIALFASLCIVIVVFLMPFREPHLPSVDIAKVGAIPSHELRSPEDNLKLWQWLSVSWLEPLLTVGKTGKMSEEDVWSLGYVFQHKRLHEAFRQLRGSVVRRTLRANGIDVLILSLLAVVDTACGACTPLLLQQLLKAMENPGSPKRIALTYAFLTLIVRLVSAQIDTLDLWYGRRCYERSRGEMTMMVYEKALSRKNIVVLEDEEKKENKSNEDERETSNGHSTGTANGSTGETKKSKRFAAFFDRFWSKSKPSEPESKPPASMGKILNLIRGDVYEVSQRYWEVDKLVKYPLQLIATVLLIWNLLGPSCFIGVSVVIVAQGLNALVTRILLQWERERRIAKDKRLNITSQFVESLRHLRWYGWQNHWLKEIMVARQYELYLQVATNLWRLLINVINSLGSNLFPVIALYAYTYIAGHNLSIDLIFPALQLFSRLDASLQDIPDLITVMLNAYVAVERLEDFMAETDREENEPASATEGSTLRLTNCTFAWPGMETPVLSNLNLTFPPGISVIQGKVGAGKTALLQALLGELDKISGTSSISNEMIGYCAQTPWLQSMSIRDNILFSAPYEEDRYKQVLETCQLLPDFAEFTDGDRSNIGENGIGLSGGQRARVALARAVYSRARILLLDDPISALDFNTAENIVTQCFNGPLMHDRTIVLVTHRIELVGYLAQQIIKVSNGRATPLDSHGALENGSAGVTPKPDTGDGSTRDQGEEKDVAKFMEEEHRAQWGIQARVYWKYIKSGKLKFWALLVLLFAMLRLVNIGRTWFLKIWGEAYNQESQSFIFFHDNNNLFSIKSSRLNATGVELSRLNPFDGYPRPQDDVKPWLLAFLVIGMVQGVSMPCLSIIKIVIDYNASKSLFQQVTARVSQATFRYYDVTPVGRLMNRLTSDIGTIDGSISSHFMGIAFQSITWISSVAIIASITPLFFLFAVLLSGLYVVIFLRFLPTSQSLRRLEMVSLSPLMSNFGELLHGLTTVRAFRSEHRFQERVITVVDKFQGMDHFYWSTQNWLGYRYDYLADISIFMLTVLALYTNVSAGLTAFVLIAASNFIQSTRYLCRRYGQLQMDFVSVERIDELLQVEQEPVGSIDPPASWPVFGSSIVFDHATIRYAPHLDPSLIDISIRIPGGSTTAIVGRTGSGKSTLATGLLNVVRPETGSITIDNLNIADVNTETLRSRVTFVAQDPVLFVGTIRLNLDPTKNYSDAACDAVLQRLCGRHNWTLSTQIEAGGRNLSQGQRQLIGLTRAVLRRSPIVILDEATASIDYESSMEIQQILREEMVEATVIMIAHRVEAVKGADYAIVLDKGRVLRQGPAAEMLGDALGAGEGLEH